jgi:secreted protein with Ig-like and vWFA domain
MKSLLVMTLAWGIALSSLAQAMPEAQTLIKRKPVSIVSVPGYSKDTVGLAVSFEYGNPCDAAVQDVFADQDKSLISVYSAYLQDAICTAHYEPTLRWSVVARGLKVGDIVSVNDQSIIVVEPKLAVCIKSICEDNSQRDAYTCACANGFTN